MPLRIWMVAAEVSPYATTGGLGEVMRALPGALARAGHEVRRFLPAYGTIPRSGFARDGGELPIEVGGTALPARFWTKTEPNGVRTTLVECDELFDREAIYGPPGGAYPDNPRRFAFLSRAVCELAFRSPEAPDVLHGHDWPAGPMAMYARCLQAGSRPLRTVFTIHNLAYQGRFGTADAEWLGLSPSLLEELFTPDGFEFFGDVSFLKAGLVFANRITTVSPTYAGEILAPELGCGLDPLLRDRSDALTGILNGADYEVWDPRRDKFIPTTYDAEGLVEGSEAARRLARAELGLPASPRPLVGVVGRFAYQKGIDVVRDALISLLSLGADVAILGEGDPDLARELARFRDQMAGRIGLRVGHDERMAHLLTAGSDLLLVPSRYEPCGLVQMYALRYGSVPVVHRTGGLIDTVANVEADPARGTGFVFSPLTPQDLTAIVRRALRMKLERPADWLSMRKRGMAKEFPWDEAARKYVRVYEAAVGQPSVGKSAVMAPAVAR